MPWGVACSYASLGPMALGENAICFPSWQLTIQLRMKKIIRFFLNQIRYVQTDIWRITKRDEEGGHGFLILLAKTLSLSIKNFVKGKMPTRASALCYYSVFALVPMMAFIFGLARGFGFDAYMMELLRERYASHLDLVTIFQEFVENYLNNARGGAFVGIGIAVLLWSVMKVFFQVEISFNEIWLVNKNRNYIRRFTDYISLLLVVPIFVLLSSGVSFYFNHAITLFHGNYIISPTLHAVLYAMPFVVAWAIFTMMYVVMPNTKVKFYVAAIAAVVSTAAFFGFKWLYVYVQTMMTTYNAVYGSLAAIPFALLFVQTTWMIILFGAEISFSLQNVRNFEFEKDVEDMSNRYMTFGLLSVTKIIALHFRDGDAPMTLDELADRHHIPIRFASEVLNRLCKSGILMECRNDSKVVYTPAMDINQMTVARFFNLVDCSGVETFGMEVRDEFSSVWDYALKMRNAQVADSGDVLVMDL